MKLIKQDRQLAGGLSVEVTKSLIVVLVLVI